MTLRDSIGQLLMIGFEGIHLSSEFIDWIQEYRPGGVILYARNLVNPEQIGCLTNSLQECAPNPPLLIAIDQEGGQVSRLPQGFTIFPSAATIANCGSSVLAHSAGAVTAKELLAVGINMNMAPVLDVNTNPANPIIGNRAYSKDPDEVCKFGVATLKGLQENGVIACGKHFPGHGDTTCDSHKILPLVNAQRPRLEQTELAPFRYSIAKGLSAIMTAHVRYPALDPDAPATLSRKILTDLLRNNLGFEGTIFTDDLEMNAILDHWSIGEAAILSLQAGADMLLICKKQNYQKEAILAVEEALKRGLLSMDRLNESVHRIKTLKQHYLSSLQFVDLSEVPQVIGNSQHQKCLEEIQKFTTYV